MNKHNKSQQYVTAFVNESKAHVNLINTKWHYNNGLVQDYVYQSAKIKHEQAKRQFDVALINELLA
jgi:hypothetical protein